MIQPRSSPRSEIGACVGSTAPRSGHQSGPNNEGLRQAAGELIAYLGHDDLWLPHHLASAVRTIDAGADLAYSIIAGITPEGRVGTYMATKPTQRMPPTGVVHRKRLTQELGGWRDYRELHVDPELDLWRRAHAAGFTFSVRTAPHGREILRGISARRLSNTPMPRAGGVVEAHPVGARSRGGIVGRSGRRLHPQPARRESLPARIAPSQSLVVA